MDILSRKKLKEQHTVFYEVQPVQPEPTEDYQLHISPNNAAGFKAMKRWLHRMVPRSLYYWDKVASYYTITTSGSQFLELLEKNPDFVMVLGIREG